MMLHYGGVPPRRPCFGVGGSAHHADDQGERFAGGVLQRIVPPIGQVAAQGRVQRLAQRFVVSLGDSVLAVVASQLGQKCHGFVSPLGDQLTEYP